MRCLKCNVDSKRKRLKETGQRCPSCGHRFVADKKTDGFSDQGLKKALEKLTDGGKHGFLPKHLEYELRRRAGRTIGDRSGVAKAAIWSVILAAIGFAVFGFLGLLGGVPHGIYLLVKVSSKDRSANFAALIHRYLTVNPSDLSVPESDAIEAQMRAYAESGPHVGIQDVLVCQHRRLVDLLCAGKFYLHHPCAIIGPKGYGLNFYPGLSGQLANPAGLRRILVAHDFSPDGNAFVEHIRGNPDWLSFHTGVQVIDVGLLEEHRPIFKGALRPVSEFSDTGGRSRTATSTPNSNGQGAELFAIAPALFITAVGASVDEGVPMYLPQPNESGSHDSGG